MPSDTKTYIYLYISLGIFIINGKLSTRKVESPFPTKFLPAHWEKKLIRKKWEGQLRTKFTNTMILHVNNVKFSSFPIKKF